MNWLWSCMVLAAVASAAMGIGILLGRRRHRRPPPDAPGENDGAAHRAQDLVVELSTIAGGLAHELKNPLSTINVNLQLLAEDLARYHDDDHRRLLRRLGHVQTEGQRLKGILDDFHHFAGKLELTPIRQDVRQIVDELADFFAPQAEAAGVIMRTRIHETPLVCNVDAPLLKQAVLNLMINAVQAMTNGGELILHVGPNGPAAEIEVIDTGPGMDPAVLEHIFDVYYSTKKHGSGLGLPIARRIARAHAGDLRVDSQPGQGTRVIITLPLATDA